jgi:hypothetical protein
VKGSGDHREIVERREEWGWKASGRSRIISTSRLSIEHELEGIWNSG